jgi:PAS domain S-box-containing protein
MKGRCNETGLRGFAAMTELADLLESQRDELSAQWAERATSEQATPELAELMPTILGKLASALRGRPDAARLPVGRAAQAATSDGSSPFRAGFDLAAVVREYGLLLEVALGLVEQGRRSIEPDSVDRDVRRLVAFAVGAISDAVIEAQRQQARDEAERRDKDERLRAVGEAIPQQVWTARADGSLDFVNQRVLEYFHSTPDRILGEAWQGTVHPEDLPVCAERWARSLRTGESYEIQFRLRRWDGVYRWHLGRALPLKDGAGVVVKWFGTSTDIDDSRRLIEDLHRRAEFEQYLAGIVSHDLRNPLGAILLGSAGLLKMPDLREPAARIARRIQAATLRASRMIDDLLDFTQARLGGGIRVERKPADLYAVTSNALDEVQGANPDRALDLTRAGDTHGEWDGDRLAQVVTNLVTNALKYSPPRTPVGVRVAGDNGQVELSIHNEGSPIPPESLSAIFEPLQRATESIGREARSVGLGLYIVHAIVRAHGGTVNVESREGQGTTFTVRLPRNPPPRC